MMSFNDFLTFDGVCAIPVVPGRIDIYKRGGVVDSFNFSCHDPRLIARDVVAWSFTSDFCERVDFCCGSVVLCSVSAASLWAPVWGVSLP